MKSASPRLLLNLARRWSEGDPVALARRALDAGFDGVGLVDSPRLFLDGWIESERVLAGTSAGLTGPVIASLGLRHASTVAGALRTLEQHHPGRAFTVVGRGESSVANEGITAPSLSDHRAAMRTLRKQLRDDAGNDRLPGRLLGAASGPRTITATATELGGVLLDVGVDPPMVERAARLARESDPATHVWIFARTLIVDDPQTAAEQADPLLGSCAMRMANAPGWFGLDADQADAVRRVADAHDYRQHGTQQRTATDDDASRLVRHRFLLVDTPTAIADAVAGLRAIGIDGIVVAGALPGVVDRLEDLGAALHAGITHPLPPEAHTNESSGPV
ncbi:MAG: hypothetical protein ABIQ53_11700 [Terracoccus sp.]